LQSALHGTLAIPGLNDYARIYLDGKPIGTLDRRLKQDSLKIDDTADHATLDILVENDGRINSTRMMLHEQKGAPQGVTLDGKPLTDWQVFSLPMTDLRNLQLQNRAGCDGPCFYSGRFRIQQVGDTFLDVRNLKKGALWINGHAIGRYWDIGPQQTLYLPGPWLRAGWNEVIVFDIDGVSAPRLSGLTNPILNGPVRDSNEPQSAPPAN
jgi:beta-galactosidase